MSEENRTSRSLSNLQHRQSIRIFRQRRVKKQLRFLPYLLIIIVSLIFIILNSSKPTHTSLDQFKEAVHQPVEPVSQSYLNKYCSEQGHQVCSQSEKVLLSTLIDILNTEEVDTFTNETKEGINIQKPIVHVPIISEYQMLTQYSLSAVKNPKLTTPRLKPSGFLDSLKNMLFYEPYEGIDALFEGPGLIWETGQDISLLTLMSSELILPNILEITSASESKCSMLLLGLTLSLQKELLATRLSTFDFFSGLNWLECQSKECKVPYSMILLRLSKCKIAKIRIFEKNVL